MARGYRGIFIHLIWHTKNNRPILHGDLELFVHRRVREMATEQGLTPIAVNSAWNHVHVLARWNTTVCFADMLRDWKGRTYTEWRKRMKKMGFESKLHWQDGGTIFSISPAEVDRLKDYIANQKEHHTKATTIDYYENPVEVGEWSSARARHGGG